MKAPFQRHAPREPRVYDGASLVEQFRARLAKATTEDQAQALHLDWCRDKATKGCSSGTRRKVTRMALARIDAIRAERRAASAAKPLIVAPW